MCASGLRVRSSRLGYHRRAGRKRRNIKSWMTASDQRAPRCDRQSVVVRTAEDCWAKGWVCTNGYTSQPLMDSVHRAASSADMYFTHDYSLYTRSHVVSIRTPPYDNSRSLVPNSRPVHAPSSTPSAGCHDNSNTTTTSKPRCAGGRYVRLFINRNLDSPSSPHSSGGLVLVKTPSICFGSIAVIVSPHRQALQLDNTLRSHDGQWALRKP